MSVELSDAEYVELVQRARQPRRGFSLSGCFVWLLCAIMFVVFMAALLPNIATSYPIVNQMIGRAGVQFSTVGVPTQLPLASPLPGDGPASAPVTGPGQPREGRGIVETSTSTPTPNLSATAHAIDLSLTALALTVGPTETAMTAEWDALEESGYFDDPYTLATPEPRFTQYTEEKCRDKDAAARSATLRLFCPKGEE